MIKGRIHSIQTLGAVDGPGLRTVVALQGCPMRCKFCHSVDTTLMKGGTSITPEELVKKIVKNRPYWKKYHNRKEKIDEDSPEVLGGVTITGGDPVAQPIFTIELLKLFKKECVHTVLETSLFTSKSVIDMFFENVDLWMISIKHIDSGVHKELTERDNKSIFENLKYLDEKITKYNNKLAKRELPECIENKKKEIRIRYVIIPGITDTPSSIDLLTSFVSKISNLENLELLPYVTMGRYKWIELFGKYPLEGIPEANSEDMQKAIKRIKSINKDLPLLKIN